MILVRLQDKLGEGIVEPRSLEEEGIFVGKKPVVPTNLVHRAEKRIIQECQADKKVFINKRINSSKNENLVNSSQSIVGLDLMEPLLHYLIQPNSFLHDHSSMIFLILH